MNRCMGTSIRPDKEKILLILKEELPYLKKQFNVSEIGLFGSYVRNEADSNSDIDILVSFSKTPGLFSFLKLEDYLSKCFMGIKVDLVLKNSLKPNIGKNILDEAFYA